MVGASRCDTHVRSWEVIGDNFNIHPNVGDLTVFAIASRITCRSSSRTARSNAWVRAVVRCSSQFGKSSGSPEANRARWLRADSTSIAWTPVNENTKVSLRLTRNQPAGIASQPLSGRSANHRDRSRAARKWYAAKPSGPRKLKPGSTLQTRETPNPLRCSATRGTEATQAMSLRG